MTLSISDLNNPPAVAKVVTEYWKNKNNSRVTQLSAWSEMRRYIYATDTRFTTDQTSGWRNQTTRNKLSRIKDTLVTLYVRNLMPTEDFFRWKLDDDRQGKYPEGMAKRLEEYMIHKNRSQFVRMRQTLIKMLIDWTEDGNTFGTVEYIKRYRKDKEGNKELVFQGARPVKVSPQKIVFDPLAETFEDTDKVRREIVPAAQFFKNIQDYYNKEVVEKLKEFTGLVTQEVQDWIEKAHNAQDGVGWLEHFDRKEIELLEYYGDIYDEDKNEYLENQHIIVANGLFVLVHRDNDTFRGTVPIVFSGWRQRPDNLWGQGPLDNILGLQHRIDHIENMKADTVDMMSMPVIVIEGEGIQEEFTWRPGEQWNVPTGAKVTILYPDPKILLLNEEILTYERSMEELAGVPRETAGFRTPGEKTAFEVDSLMNNASGMFEEKLMAFEADVLEPLLNLMMELNLRNITTEEIANIFPENILGEITDEAEDGGVELFKQALTEGRLYAIGSKHYKLRQQKIQVVSNLLGLAKDNPAASIHIANYDALKMIEEELGLDEKPIVVFGAGHKEQAGLEMLKQEIQEQMKEQQQQG